MDVGVVELRNYGEALLFEAITENTVQKGGVNAARIEGLDVVRLISDNANGNLVSGRVETKVIERQHRAHPEGPANSSNTETLAAQILRFAQPGSGHQVIGQPV